jgi:hypothetical protein
MAGPESEVVVPRISQEDAARIARKHGLSLTDANALFEMAESTAQAENLAAEFARPAQLNKEDVRQLYREGKHAEIVRAKDEGRLADMLGQAPKAVPAIPAEDPAPARPTEGLKSGAGMPHERDISREDLKGMTPDAILTLKEAGRLNHLLGISPKE